MQNKNNLAYLVLLGFALAYAISRITDAPAPTSISRNPHESTTGAISERTRSDVSELPSEIEMQPETYSPACEPPMPPASKPIPLGYPSVTFEVDTPYPELKRAAESGDAEAAYKLYLATRICSGLPRDAAAFEMRMAEIAKTRSTRGNLNAGMSDEEILWYTEPLRKAFPFCSTIPPGDKTTDIEWLTAAADGRQIDALIEFVQLAYFGAKTVEWYADTVRERMFQSLQDRAIATKSWYGLTMVSIVYARGAESHQPIDRIKAYAYSEASRRLQGPHAPPEEAGGSELARGLRPHEIEEAEQLAARLLIAMDVSESP